MREILGPYMPKAHKIQYLFTILLLQDICANSYDLSENAFSELFTLFDGEV